MAQIIVQDLETIQVEQHHRQGFPGTVPRQRVLQVSQEHGPVAEAGKRVQQAVFAIGLRPQELGLDARVHDPQVDRLDDIIVRAQI